MARTSVSKRPIWLVDADRLGRDPAMRWIVGGHAIKGRAELPDHAMPPVLAGTDVLEKTPGNLGQAKGIVKLPIGEKSSVGSDLGTVELKLQSTVEIDP